MLRGRYESDETDADETQRLATKRSTRTVIQIDPFIVLPCLPSSECSNAAWLKKMMCDAKTG